MRSRDNPTTAAAIAQAALLWWGYTVTYVASIFDPRSDSQSADNSVPHFVTAAGR
jgi:hypothetical protein